MGKVSPTTSESERFPRTYLSCYISSEYDTQLYRVYKVNTFGRLYLGYVSHAPGDQTFALGDPKRLIVLVSMAISASANEFSENEKPNAGENSKDAEAVVKALSKIESGKLGDPCSLQE